MMYVGVMRHLISSLYVFLYSDDTILLYSGSYVGVLVNMTNAELDKLHVWLSVNRLSVNLTKENTL